ncbi:MAG: hypothetical protein K2X71_07380 [Methylobacterium sp.]|uniref:hypothetical protein n=1 Tax=Methylobacterium sp. TaxID=409 RepID=UPI0025902165|nr:hypothetical protein [Methylobacterium sp.]MBY0295841.1 hypothetical protein [Methylobacterium sp.]
MRIGIVALLLLVSAAAAQQPAKDLLPAPAITAKPCDTLDDPRCARILAKRPPPATTPGGGGIKHYRFDDVAREIQAERNGFGGRELLGPSRLGTGAVSR